LPRFFSPPGNHRDRQPYNAHSRLARLHLVTPDPLHRFEGNFRAPLLEVPLGFNMPSITVGPRVDLDGSPIQGVGDSLEIVGG